MSALSRTRLWFRAPRLPDQRRLRILDLNCLAPSLVDPARYRDCDPRYLDARTRVQGIKNEIQFFTPDIICLQELEWVDYKSLTNANSLDGTYVQHAPGRRIDGTAVIWPKDKFDLLHAGAILPLPTSPLDRYLRSTAVVLRERVANEPCTIIVASSHLLFNCGRADVKYYQTCAIVDALYQLRLQFGVLGSVEELSDTVLLQRCQSLPAIIWCGDFNFTPMSPLYTAILTRTPDDALQEVADEALSSQARCLSQKLLSGQHALFFQEGRRPYSCADHKVREAVARDLRERPIRQKQGYLGGAVASRVHRRVHSVEHISTVGEWMKRTGPDLASWSSACFLTISAATSLTALKNALLSRPDNSWLSPLNLKSAQCLRDATQHDPQNLVEPCYTAYHREQAGCIDYIWYSPDVLRVTGICAQAVTAGSSGMPSVEYPVSDHLPVVVEFSLPVADPAGTTYHVIWRKSHRQAKADPHPPSPSATHRDLNSCRFADLLSAEYAGWINQQVRSVRDLALTAPLTREQTETGSTVSAMGEQSRLSAPIPAVSSDSLPKPKHSVRRRRSTGDFRGGTR